MCDPLLTVVGSLLTNYSSFVIDIWIVIFILQKAQPLQKSASKIDTEHDKPWLKIFFRLRNSYIIQISGLQSNFVLQLGASKIRSL